MSLSFSVRLLPPEWELPFIPATDVGRPRLPRRAGRLPDRADRLGVGMGPPRQVTTGDRAGRRPGLGCGADGYGWAAAGLVTDRAAAGAVAGRAAPG
jgi:hypothetical protein